MRPIDLRSRAALECFGSQASAPLATDPGSVRPCTDAMAITYYKRLRMEIDLDGVDRHRPRCRGRFVWVPWEESLLADHAEVKYQSFRGEIDAYVFPCLGDRYGCQRLMREIRRKPGFLPRRDLADRLSRGLCRHGPGGDGPRPDRRDPEPGRAPRLPGHRPGPRPGPPGPRGLPARPGCAGPISRSPPRTPPPSSSTGASASAAPRPSTRPSTADWIAGPTRSG